jgi:polygalacturonase
MLSRFAVFCVFSAVLVSSLAAQDTRKVVEPLMPEVCTTVDAHLQSHNGKLSPADESKLDTARIQRAIDRCGKGRAVILHVDEDKNAFLTGPLQMRPDVTLIVDMGVTLFASRDPKLYALSPGSCGLVNHSAPGCKPLISADHAPNSGVMGDGVIDGRGGEKMLGSPSSWWDLAEQARKGGRQQVPRLIVVNGSNNFTLYRVTLKNSPNFHVVFNDGDGFTVWGVHIDTPQRGARNTDGIDPGNGAKNITIMNTYIRTGDDNVAIKGGPGGVTNMTVARSHFYWGHGMSIGSETMGGVSHILVTDLSIDGADNGLRIKSNGSRGGVVSDVIYDDTCIRNSPHPITFDMAYTDSGTLKGNSPPSVQDVVLHDVRISGGGKISFSGYGHTHRIDVLLNGVQITDDAKYSYVVNHADLRLGPEPTNLQLPAGTDSTMQGKPAEGTPASCAAKFVPFPH